MSDNLTPWQEALMVTCIAFGAAVFVILWFAL